MQTLLAEQYSGIGARRRDVIRDRAQWAAFWREMRSGGGGGGTNSAVPPEVDFSRDMVVVAAMGTRGSGGHRVAIDSVTRSEGRLLIVVREVSPGKGA